jgi:transcriptional regulator with XRE-family HTH domain
MVSTVLCTFNEGMKDDRTDDPVLFTVTFIREWRKHRKMTLEALGAEIDMSASHLSMLERGQRGYTQETLEKIAEVLDTSTGALLNRNPLKEGVVWSEWEKAAPADRKLAIELLKTAKNSGT